MTERAHHKAAGHVRQSSAKLIEALERNRARASDPSLRARLGDAIGRLRPALTPRQVAAVTAHIASRYGE